MAPIIKTSLAVLSIAGALVGSVTAGPAALHDRRSFGRHHKLTSRNTFEELVKKANDAPYGYDRCGFARSKPYQRRAGESRPSASPSLKPCSAYGPGKNGNSQVVVYESSTPLADPASSISQDTTAKQGVSQASTGTGTTGSGSTGSNTNPPVFTPAKPVTPPVSTGSIGITSVKGAYVSDTSGPGQNQGSQPASGNGNASSASSASSAPSSAAPSAPASSPVSQAPQAPAPSSSSISSSSSSSSSSAPAYTPPAPVSVSLTPSSSSPAPPAYTPPVVNNNSGGKKLGLAWDWRNPYGAINSWAGAGQAYTWSEYPPSGGMPAGMSWLPMFTCTDKAAGFASQVASGAIHPGMDILTFNEPDQAGQCPMSPADAAGAYRELITKPYGNKGYTLWSPAPTNSYAGRQWLVDFMSMCGDCGIGGIAIHWYGTSADDFINYVSGIHAQFNMPIKVTEFAPMDFTYSTTPLSIPEISAFLAKTQGWLEQQSYITGYYFFGAVTTPALGGVNPNVKLIDDGGAITSLGWQYLGAGK